ncbi:prephenate dehydratase [Algoriphagus halophytocola]|uniref:prephenate dehydratase n=1 Tax=Algoriphagus halophytocola TaxID=2991499 RepID=A0ABY6MFZ8_9BACT|nr:MULTISPECIES: prephenate dehydratase [unclassified Algoriphagus]UZD22733.1 prephenate dehydratase [Algoriphagus sp. TR-M5]WBL43998.1 prephenate dehydratase [Algoriphagus sp. TR-M9]
MAQVKIAIQGVLGSFHHQVALRNFGDQIEILDFTTFEPVARAVANGEADYAVMAIENSIAGAILPNYDLIDRYGLSIRDEYYLPIGHQFMALPGQSIQEITEVRSHPMALLQCKAFFAQHPHIQLKEDTDTASVARDIANGKWKGVASIASTVAAKIYGMEILAQDIQTVKSNFTRFIILQKDTVRPDQSVNKASIKVTIQNQKGGLAKLLTLIAENGMDLSKIQSIPVIEKPWEYAFFIDLVFGDHSIFSDTIEEIRTSFGEVKIFGEYLSRK